MVWCIISKTKSDNSQKWLGTRIVSPKIAKQVDDVFTKLLFSKVFVEVCGIIQLDG